jgi:dihydroxy-acid dehydratase
MDENRSMSGMRPLRSRATTDGLDRAPHRAFLRAMGLNDEAIARPFIAWSARPGKSRPAI